MKPAFAITLFLLLAFFQTEILAQQDTTLTYQVETTDGNVFVGKLLSRNENAIVLKTENLGVLTIPFKTVKELKEVTAQKIVDGDIWPDNPHASRYFYLPNGYGLKKGEGYYQNTWVLFNQLSYGITNNFSMGVGIIPAFLFGTNGAPVWLTPKFSFPVKQDKWNIGAGAILATYLGEKSSNVSWIGMTYGVSTFGSKDKNFTVGAGFAFAGDEWANTPVISLGGTIRTGKRHYFLTENYFFFGNGEAAAMIWLGGRFASRHLAIDYGGIIPAGADLSQVIIIPWLSLTVPFGIKQKAYVASPVR